LQSAVDAFLERKPLVIEVRDFKGIQPSDLGYKLHSWVARVRETVPVNLSGMIGDCVHNLRASLDLMACDLVRLNGKSDKGVYFPFSEDAADFDDMMKRRNLHRATPDVRDLIRSLEPYKGGNKALRAVHDLDIIDKHQTLIPAMQYVSSPPYIAASPEGNVGGTVTVKMAVAGDGDPIANVPAMPGISPGDLLEIEDLTLVFPGEVPFAWTDILPTLHELTELVAGIVETFEAHCIGVHGDLAAYAQKMSVSGSPGSFTMRLGHVPILPKKLAQP
jgi:hypothetical protein